MENLYLNGQVLLSEPLRRYTSLEIGGPAEALVFPADVNDLRQVLKLAKDWQVPFFILGAGSNLLVRDGGIEGLVINLCLGFKEINRQDNRLRAQAGALISKVLAYAQANQLSGLEFLAGVPGTIGGAVIMNAGTSEGEIGQLVSSVSLLDLDGNLLHLDRKQIEFTYRGSSLTSREIILEAQLELASAESELIESKTAHFLKHRQESQPAGLSAGSIFKNPPGDYAGRLIEEVGLKGFSIGNARVSKQHGNFILNKETASAQDVETLIQFIQQEVWKQRGIWLEPEVKIVGQAQKTLYSQRD